MTPTDQMEQGQVEGKRMEALKNLYIGTILGHLFDDLFPYYVKSN